MIKRSILIASFLVSICQILYATDRAEEIRKEMWQTSDKDFYITDVPEKWATKSAVILAKLHRFEYRKKLVVAVVQENQYNHFRIKLLDKNAVNKYAEMSYDADVPGYSASNGLHVYVGFKVIKPDGKEIIVDLKSAVKMERSGYRGKIAYYKIAIPNLEPGDIIDYYICHENEESILGPIHFFSPFIYNLPQEYPLIKQKIHFKIQRRCYINLRSLNGAPLLKMVNDKVNDEQYFSLEDGDRDGVADVKWLYPYRDLPSIKFRASYAANATIVDRTGIFAGEQGEVKSKVTADEVTRAINLSLTPYVPKKLSKFIKTNCKKETDPFVISTEAYQFVRNDMLDHSEMSLLDGDGAYDYSERWFVGMFSAFLKSKKIPHDIVVCVRRNISALDDIILENEIDLMVRVKKGSSYKYFSTPTMNKPAGIIPHLYQGTEAYAIDGLAVWGKRAAKAFTLPSSTSKDNETVTTLTAKTTDLTTLSMSVNAVYKGLNLMGPQAEFIDVFDAIEDEKGRKYPEVSVNDVVFSSRDLKRYAAAKEAYLAEKPKKTLEDAKKSVQGDYDFEIKELTNFKVLQTGRYEAEPEMSLSFDCTTDQVIKKTGPNYIIDIGKLIEQQVKLEADDLERPYNIYFDYPRAFRYHIVFEIPEGYQVQGIEKLNQKVENGAGGFVSTAREENGKLIIDTHKRYEKYTLPKSEWQDVVAFINATSNFTEQKILLKKK